MHLPENFGDIATLCASYVLKPEIFGFTSKALPHQTASFLEGVPYSHLQSCLNYLISDPVFDTLLIENS